MKPETVLIAFTRAKDCRKGPGLSIMVFVTKSFCPDGSVEFEREPTEENVRAEIAKGGFKCVSWRFITESEIPTDRTFRNAWEDTGTIGHDMVKCREIHKDRIRRARAPKLQQLDVEYQRAIEEGNVKYRVEVVAKKRRLRDATDDPRIEAAQTVDELKAAWPLDE